MMSRPAAYFTLNVMKQLVSPRQSFPDRRTIIPVFGCVNVLGNFQNRVCLSVCMLKIGIVRIVVMQVEAEFVRLGDQSMRQILNM